MAATLLLDRTLWDSVLDANGNIAVATEPYSLSQDAASAIKTVLGECYWDTSVGVPWQSILGSAPSLALLKEQLIQAAETVPGVASAQVYFTSFADRLVSGQVQVVSQSTGQVSSATFAVSNPQGGN